MDTINKLDTLANYQAERDYLALERQRLLDEAMPAEVKARLAEIEAEFDDKAAVVGEKIAALEAEIRAAVLAYGASVKGQYMQAVFVNGRVSWNTKALDGYAAAHPEIGAFRQKGEPSVSLRKVA